MQGDDRSNDGSSLLSGDTTTTPPKNHDNMFAAELHDLELRLEQLELEQRSLRIQLQRARLHRAEHTTTTPSAPPTTRSWPQQTSVRHSPTPGRTPCCSGAVDGRRSNPVPVAQAPENHTSHSNQVPVAQAPGQHTSHQFPAAQVQTPEQRTPQVGDHLDATGQVLRIGDEVSFLTTNYTAGGTATIQ